MHEKSRTYKTGYTDYVGYETFLLPVESYILHESEFFKQQHEQRGYHNIESEYDCREGKPHTEVSERKDRKSESQHYAVDRHKQRHKHP